MAGVDQTPPVWHAWALRLGRAERRAAANFLDPGERSGSATLDFTMWVIAHGDTVVVVDTGFDAAAGARRGRVLDVSPAEAVESLGFAPADVSLVVLTHLHYDHAGNTEDFLQARVLVQGAELRYATGPSMRHPTLHHFFEADDVAGLVRRIYAGRVDVVEGDTVVAPGLEMHLLGGHTPGLQVVRVHTARGWVVLASDAMHYYANAEQQNPFPALVDLPQVLDGYERMRALAASPDHVVPGHDPLVFSRYASPDDPRDGVVDLSRDPRPIR